MSHNRDLTTGQQSGFQGGNFGSDFGRGYSSEDRDYDDFQSNAKPARGYTGGFGRNTGSDRGDYTLYGYDRDSQYSSGSDQERGYYNRGGDYGYGSNFGSSGSNFDRMSASDSMRRDREGNRNVRNERSNETNRQSLYGQSGDYSGDYADSNRGYETENRGNSNRDERGWWDRTSDEISSWFGDDEAAQRRERDARQGGGDSQTSHRGRGPKNYRRSDERIRDDINDRLTDYPYLDASDIEVEVNNGEVVLTGTVDSRYAKRMAEDVTEDVSGVSHVENRLRVKQNSSGYNSSTGTSGYTSSTASAGGSASGGSLTGGTTGTSGTSTGISTSSTTDATLGASTGTTLDTSTTEDTDTSTAGGARSKSA